MGCRSGRGTALTNDLADTLRAVAGMMAAASDEWWIIGSAAVTLSSGADCGARDVDVMLSVADADRLSGSAGIAAIPAGGDALFRSQRFLRSTAAPLPVEFMAGFMVRVERQWEPVRFASRRSVMVRDAELFVPDAAELRALLLRFGRAKDHARATLL